MTTLYIIFFIMAFLVLRDAFFEGYNEKERPIKNPSILWKWTNGRQAECNYKKFCLWSIKIFNIGLDGYILKYQAQTDLPWHTDKVEGQHWRLNIKLKGRAYFLVRGIDRKLIHDKIILFRPDIHEHCLVIITPTIKLSFGFAKFK